MAQCTTNRFPDFGYDINPAFKVVDMDVADIPHIPDGSPTGFKGVVAACRLIPRSERQRGEVRLGFLAGDLPRHSDVLYAAGLREDQQPVMEVPYAGRVWLFGGRFAWEQERNLVDVDLYASVGKMEDMRAVPEHRGFSLVVGLAVGRAVMEYVGADPSTAQIELTTVPNFENRAEEAIREQMRLPHLMTQVLEIVELG